MRASEDELIARYFAPIAGLGGLGLRDDAALIRPPPRHDLVVTTDAIVAGVHFYPDDPPGSVAAKAIGVNLSDLAAKGADPVGFVLTLALPDGWNETWLADFAAELGEVAARYSCPLLGGDTVRAAGPLLVSVTAFGTVPQGRMVARTTAAPGDLILVTGTIGDAALGLLLADERKPDWASDLHPATLEHLIDRYRRPQPRIAIASALRDHASAAMDISDGFAGDLAKLLRVSDAGARVELERVPLSPEATAAVRADRSLRDVALTGGDDYEVICTAKPRDADALRTAAIRRGVPLTVVGEVTSGPGLVFLDDGMPGTLQPRSFSHF